MTVLNPLQRGALCVVTTSDGRIVTGYFLGIEVAYGDRSILIEGDGRTHSVPVETVSSTARATPRAA